MTRMVKCHDNESRRDLKLWGVYKVLETFWTSPHNEWYRLEGIQEPVLTHRFVIQPDSIPILR